MNNEDLLFEENNRILTVRINTEIDHHSARKIREKIDEEIFMKNPLILVLNLKNVRFMDSSGIALILGRVESCRAMGAKMQLTGLSKTLYKLVRLAGIEKIHGITIGEITE